MVIKKNVSLADFTSFKVGGSAAYFARIKSEEDLKEALDFVKKKKVSLHILGSGSNLLVNDNGFGGLVIKNEIMQYKTKISGPRVLVTIGGGEDWSAIVDKTVGRGWSGIESLAGIPGTAGAAAVQNIGAYGQSLKDVLVDVRAYDLRKKKYVTICAKDCALAYRTSLFKKRPDRYVITKIRISLRKKGLVKNSYQDHLYIVNKEIKKNKPTLTPKNISLAVKRIRKKKGMLIEPNKKGLKSAGSFFMAPVVSKKVFERIKRKAQNMDDKKTKELMPWYWSVGHGRLKIAPAFLLEFTPYHKGYVDGPVGISPAHSLALINRRGARAKDIVRLARKMQRAVKKKFGIWLKPEVRLLGFKKDPFTENS